MEILDASAGGMVSGGEWVFDSLSLDRDGGGGGFGDIYPPPEVLWSTPKKPSPPSEAHLEFDSKLADATGYAVGNAVTLFVGGFLEGAALGSETGPGAILAGIVVGGIAAYGAKKAIAHNK